MQIECFKPQKGHIVFLFRLIRAGFFCQAWSKVPNDVWILQLQSQCDAGELAHSDIIFE